ncbi:MAG TPA: leucyl/phenylalanyl-tRNA--protein transferase [Roseiflexaceae bacterium]|jgi:leucyl/phenylalanyl-tRNA--protein transferase|nr:leucyl/phenylalanyl-tRNA--protein transferase [Roseiflexaceae bacterium]
MKLTPELLLSAYCQGVFPMAHDDGMYWYDPDPRAIIPLDERFHVPRRLSRTVRSGRFDMRVDTAFRAVMEGCAAPRADHEGTWISPEFVDAYTKLHRLGFAHSVEAWRGGQLVGGLYGVAVRGLFAGESMFSREADASKVALVHLVERLRHGGFVLLDTQFTTEHLQQFGTYEISRRQYKALLAHALTVEATF